jgi:hypothetical protein
LLLNRIRDIIPVWKTLVSLKKLRERFLKKV